MSPSLPKRVLTLAANPAWISFIWFGMTAGVSLLATPARFGAPTISRPVALDVGRVVFATLNKAELIALIVLLATVRLSGRSRELWLPVFALALVLLTQSIWLLPELAARAEMIVAGVEPAPSIAHAAYSVLELAKLALLAWLGFGALAAAARSSPTSAS